jgi:hypothetical protein
MTTPINPFVRSYRNFTVRRVLMITYDDDERPRYLPLHSSQQHLPDDDVQYFPCTFCDDFALITEGQDVPDELDAECSVIGSVEAVFYEITADDFGSPVHVGNCYSAESAQRVIERLTFETGRYSRCWEISAVHLPDYALHYLVALALAGDDEPTGLLFEPIVLPDSNTVGCKLLGTPWTNEHLAETEGTSAELLRQEQLRAGVPESLVNLLHLAALADTRIFILDDEAKVLEGLRRYDR